MVTKVRTAWLAVLALVVLVATPVAAQQSDEDIRKEIEALKKGQAEIQKQLADIKRLVQQRQAPARPAGPKVEGVVFNLGSNDVKGSKDARLTLIEFTDYQ